MDGVCLDGVCMDGVCMDGWGVWMGVCGWLKTGLHNRFLSF